MNARSVVGLLRKLRATRRCGYVPDSCRRSGGCKQTGLRQVAFVAAKHKSFGSLCKWRRTARALRSIYPQSLSFPNGWPATVFALLCTDYVALVVSVFLCVLRTARYGTCNPAAQRWSVVGPSSVDRRRFWFPQQASGGRIKKAANSTAINLVVKCARNRRLIAEVGVKVRCWG